jgi:type II secretory pathway pseudopilin PulG
MAGNASNEAGFSLAETLVALVIISLSLGGVFIVAGLGAKIQTRVMAQKVSAQAIQSQEKDLSRRLALAGPYTSDNFDGTPAHFIVSSEGVATMGYRAPEGLRLRYVGDTGALDNWPDIGLTDDAGHIDARRQGRLRAVVLTDVKGVPVVTIRLRVDERAACNFNAVSQTCAEVSS